MRWVVVIVLIDDLYQLHQMVTSVDDHYHNYVLT